MPHILQYDMGLRLWVLTDPKGQILQTYLSRQTALQDRDIARIVERGGALRIRNADGSFEPLHQENPLDGARSPASARPPSVVTRAA